MSGVEAQTMIYWGNKYAEAAQQDPEYGAQLYVGFLALSLAALNVLEEIGEGGDELEKALEFTHGDDYERIVRALAGNIRIGELLEQFESLSEQHVQGPEQSAGEPEESS